MGIAHTPAQPPLSLKSTPLLKQSDLVGLLLSRGRSFREQAESYAVAQPIAPIFYGKTPLLVCASHATPHVRHGAAKPAERLTGSLSISLAQSLDATVIVPIAPQSDDPNYDIDDAAPYKMAIAEVLCDFHLLLDLHGMKDHWGPDICVGTGAESLSSRSQQLLSFLAHRCTQSGIAMSIDYPFTSTSKGTVASFSRRHGCEALQMELSLRCREPHRIAETFLVIREALCDWLKLCDVSTD